jgi:hypothetical protein
MEKKSKKEIEKMPLMDLMGYFVEKHPMMKNLGFKERINFFNRFFEESLKDYIFNNFENVE